MQPLQRGLGGLKYGGIVLGCFLHELGISVCVDAGLNVVKPPADFIFGLQISFEIFENKSEL